MLPQMLLAAAAGVLAAGLGVVPGGACAAAPETIFTGRFVTLDRSHPRADAVAVSAGRIVAMGSRAEVEPLAGPDTRRISIPGVVFPGFADAHLHVAEIGEQLGRLDVRGLTKAEVIEKVAQAAGAARQGGWIFGEGWDQGFWHPAVFPSPGELDAVSRGHPVVLGRIDGHSVWVNSEALARAGISKDTPDPQGGHIMRDGADRPTGVLVDNARELLRRVMPKPTQADQERRIRAALRQFARWGLTSVGDAGVDLATIAIYKGLLKQKQLPLRVYAMALGEEARAYYLANGPEADLGGGMLAVRSFKLFSDGALGSRGAELTEPYSDAPREHGLELISDAQLDLIVRAARQKGIQVNVHAIGDRAVARVLDAFQRAGVRPEDRFRVEHASVVADPDVLRFDKLGVIASIQPVFVGEYSRWAEDRVGPVRAHWVLRTADFVKAGVLLASGSDYPASDSGTPIAALHCLVTRQGAAGTPVEGWHSDQRVDVDRALRLLTAGPAYAEFKDKDLGAISVGRYADFTSVTANPYEVPSNDLRTLGVEMTVVAGQVIYRAGGQRH
jgi:predicted amidohydrolase YtcJ